MSGPIVDIAEIGQWKDSGPLLYSEIRPTISSHRVFNTDNEINKLISVWRYGDITRIKCDAIISRTDNTFSTGGVLFRTINSVAGPELAQECAKLGRCEDMNTAITPGFNLPAKFVIHTVGPIGEEDEELEQTLDSIFSHIDGINVRSLAITSFFIENNAFSLVQAAKIVLRHTRIFLENEENRNKIDRIVFVDSNIESFKILVQLMYYFFPLDDVESVSEGAIDSYSEEENDESFEDNGDIMMLNHLVSNSYPNSPNSDGASGLTILF